jgi:hypothetical protein
MKIVVFDLDETLGYFTQFGIFWDSLVNYTKNTNNTNNTNILNQEDFDDTFDLFPEYLRPNILKILTYLKKQKQSKICHKIMIYTNNNGTREWAQHISKYFENKIGYKLIDQIIAAFKVNGKVIEMCRTTYNKTHKDFISCTKVPENAEICFLDDTFYPQMSNENIYYINVKPYYCDLVFDYMLERFYKSEIGKKLIHSSENYESFYSEMMKYIKQYNYKYNFKKEEEHEIDKIVGKQIMIHLKDFFIQNRKNKTNKKIHNKITNKTMKNRK